MVRDGEVKVFQKIVVDNYSLNFEISVIGVNNAHVCQDWRSNAIK